MKNLLLSFCLFLVSATLFAQDIVRKLNGTSENVKVMEVGNSSVKVKNSEGLVYEIQKNEIEYIMYQNGFKENYNFNNTRGVVDYTQPNPVKRNDTEDKIEYGKNIVALNMFEMLFSNFSISYERILKNGKVGIKIPLSVGLDGRPNDDDYESSTLSTQFLQNRIYAGGIELNFYPLAHSRHLFFIGLSAFTGSFNYYHYIYDTTNYNGYPQNRVIGKEKHTGTHYSGMVHIGGYVALTKNIMLGSKIGLGYKREETIVESYTNPRLQLDINLAYRF